MLRYARFVDLLESFSSSDPTPGGGSASALAGAVGAALLAMVAGLPRTRHAPEHDRPELDQARAALLALRDTLADLVDADTAAYDRVVAAFRLPKGTDEERAVRGAAVQEAFRGATETPLAVMRAAAEVARHGVTVSSRGNPSASSDVQVGLELAMAGLRGAGLNVDINLPSLKDTALAARVREEARMLTVAAERHVAEARGRLS